MSLAIEPVAAPASTQAQDQRQRHSAPFGAAVTYREVVQEKLRVDPAAVAARMADPARQEKPRTSVRQQRLAEEEAAYDARRDARPGAYIDIEV